MVVDYTVVIGVDAKHLKQLSWTLPTWARHKPSLFDRPWIVFYDREDVKIKEDLVPETISLLPASPKGNITYVAWPPDPVVWEGDDQSKWTSKQRHKMLAGHVHVPARFVETPWWLKLDTDAIASGEDDWIRDEWFENDPVFVGSPWGYTKPADQIVELDRWAEKTKPICLEGTESLNLVPKLGHETIRIRRAVSWCAFFNTEFGCTCSAAAEDTVGRHKLPVPSQDGYLWYMATRMGLGINKVQMKRHGWQVRNTQRGILECVKEAMR
jgi:hypothetical protein